MISLKEFIDANINESSCNAKKKNKTFYRLARPNSITTHSLC